MRLLHFLTPAFKIQSIYWQTVWVNFYEITLGQNILYIFGGKSFRRRRDERSGVRIAQQQNENRSEFPTTSGG